MLIAFGIFALLGYIFALITTGIVYFGEPTTTQLILGSIGACIALGYLFMLRNNRQSQYIGIIAVLILGIATALAGLVRLFLGADITLLQVANSGFGGVLAIITGMMIRDKGDFN